MRMIRPQLDAPQVTIAEEQDEYKPLTAALVHNPLYGARMTDHGPINTVVLAFRPNDDERARLAAGEDFYISLLTGGGPMQPINVNVGATETAASYGVAVEAPPAGDARG